MKSGIMKKKKKSEGEKNMQKQVYEINELKKVLNIDRKSALELVRNGKIKADRIHEKYLVSKKNLDKYLEVNKK
jgi:excisionase family DNA binding protein